MKDLVENIISVWHKRTVERLGLPQDQKCIWLIDA